MILSFFLIILFGLLLLISIGLLIFGLIKKKKNLIITASVLGFIGVMGCAFSVFNYTTKAIAYVKSKEFQNDARKGAEFIGETVGSTTSGISSGLSTTIDEEAIDKLAQKSTTIVGKVTKTVASTFDSTLGNKNIYLDKSLENSGFQLGRAEEVYNSKSEDVEINIGYTKDFSGNISITNYDQNGRIIEVVNKNIKAKAGDNKVEVFNFQHADPGLTTYYILSKPKA